MSDNKQSVEFLRNQFVKSADLFIQAAEKRHKAGFLVAKSVERMKDKFNEYRTAAPDDAQELGAEEVDKWVAFVEETEKAGLIAPEMTDRLKDISKMLND